MTLFPDRTLPHSLLDVSQIATADRGYTFVEEDGRTERYLSFTQLEDEVSRYAAAMLRLGLRRGDRVAMIVPESERFVLTFLGAMHAGLVPVPMCPPMTLGKLGNYLESSRHIVQRAEATALICTSDVKKIVGSLAGGSLRFIVSVDELPLSEERATIANITNDDPAFIQFTSGSTSRPKGVVLTHGNLSANAHCIMNLGLNATPEDRGCTWLPFYHDMGLIGFVLAPIVTQTPVAFLPPLAFLKRPAHWFRMISRHRGTIGFGPNFAYGLCTSRIKDHELEGIDLSSWRIAGCGAEPIQKAVLDSFADRFASVGFRREAFMPCFGMAESTLAVSFFDTSAAPRADHVRLDALTSKNRAVPHDDSTVEMAAFVSCGKPFPGHELGIMDEAGHLLGDRAVGEIVIKGPSVMKEYWNDPAATAETIRNGWLHTGDRGYLADGELHVCGRIKDMIIVAGRNYYPTDIEWACNDVAGVRRGNVVAFGVGEFTGNESVVVCAELRDDKVDREQITHDVKARVLELVGVRVNEVLLLEQGALPKTSSGKLQRRKTRQMYIEGDLQNGRQVEGKLDLVKHMAVSQWGHIKNAVRNTLPGFMR
jgi:acyl-CoA synthetase (AMP-forming)/AMP-acid ligase II